MIEQRLAATKKKAEEEEAEKARNEKKYLISKINKYIPTRVVWRISGGRAKTHKIFYLSRK